MKTTSSWLSSKIITMSVRQILCLLVIATAGLLQFGCKQADKVGKAAVDPTGAYTLVSVDGKAIPANVSHDGAALQVRSGAFTINPDGTCSSKMIFVPPNGNEVTRVVNATYTQEGSKLTMKWERAGMTAGTVDGNTFTMNNEGMVFVYKK